MDDAWDARTEHVRTRHAAERQSERRHRDTRGIRDGRASEVGDAEDRVARDLPQHRDVARGSVAAPDEDAEGQREGREDRI